MRLTWLSLELVRIYKSFRARYGFACSPVALKTDFRAISGISGIAAAKFYLDIHPACRLVILEQDSCPGGTWNSGKNEIFGTSRCLIEGIFA